MPKKKTQLEPLIYLIDQHIEETDKELTKAVAQKRWPLPPHFDGVACGLIVAKNIVKDMIRSNLNAAARKNKPKK